MQRLFLVGLSGSGKTTIGREAARLLGWDFIDTDDLLAGRCGMPVGQALVEYGEARFRELESEALASAAAQERVVVATGGGVVIAETNRAFMREHGLVIYLHTPVETAWERVQEQLRSAGIAAVRPLLAGDDGLQRLQALYAARRQWYEEAAVHIETGNVSYDHVARQVVAAALVKGCITSVSPLQQPDEERGDHEQHDARTNPGYQRARATARVARTIYATKAKCGLRILYGRPSRSPWKPPMLNHMCS